MKAELRNEKEERWKERQEHVNSRLNEKMRRIVLLGSEKGASTWLTSLPLKSYGFRLNKQQFQDALCMRYDLKLRMFQGNAHEVQSILSTTALHVNAEDI